MGRFFLSTPSVFLSNTLIGELILTPYHKKIFNLNFRRLKKYYRDRGVYDSRS